MKTNYIVNLEILFLVFLVVTGSLLAEECNSSGINCISCTSYQKCDGGNPVGPILKGNECDQEKLEQCHVKYNCYGLNECTQAGVFPDAEDESNYYVCLNDPTAFIKYEFRCVEGEFFDKTTLMCIPKAATLTDTSSLENTAGETESSSEGSSTSSTESLSESSSTSSTESSSEGSSTSSTESSSEGSSTSSTESSSEGSSTSSTESPEDPSTSSTESSSEGSSTSSTESSSESSSTSSTESSSEGSSTSSTESSSEGSSTSSTESSSEASSTSSIESSSTASTSSTEITTSTPSPTISTTASPFVCPAPGIFPSPSNCKIYHRCSTSLKLFNYVCPGTSYFNENLLKCSMIITPACQAQILQNSSSTVTTPATSPTPTTEATTTTTTTTTTTMTTSSPTTTTSTTTTTTTTPSTTTTTTTPSPTRPIAFSCPMPGTFSNPNSCKTYYRCSTSGRSFVYTCPGETYFNEFTKRCSLQITPRCQKLLQSWDL